MRAGADLPIRCSCGAVQGVVQGVSPNAVNRCICYCESCQRYLRELGKAEQVLDENGGTDVFQVSPRRVTLAQGDDRLGCLQLTRKGAFRWYATCCNTPIANTLPNSRFPFVAILHDACIDRSALDAPLDAHLGPVRAGVNHGFDKERAKALRATRWDLLPMFLRLSPMTLAWAIRGDHRRSPFFDATTGDPIVAPGRKPESPGDAARHA